jgi:hypothetical protein
MRHGQIVVFMTLLLATPAAANQLSGADIQAEIVGRQIFLAAPLGGEFPLNYRSNGVVDGSGEALGLGRLFKPSDRGKWWVRGDRLCQKFENWYNGTQLCFTLTRTGPDKLRWVRDNGESGTARIGARLN